MRKREKEQGSSLAIRDGAGLFGYFFCLNFTDLCLNSLGFSICFGFLKVRYQSQQSWWLVYLNQESGRVCRELVDVNYADVLGNAADAAEGHWCPWTTKGTFRSERNSQTVQPCTRNRAAVRMI